MIDFPTETHRLRNSRYPGRGIVIGLAPDGRGIIQVYWIMGRSESSRNRVFVRDGDTVRTDTVDKSLPVDPLTLYAPVRVAGRAHVVTNGDQTDTVAEYLGRGETFEAALATRTYEPDAPNYTPRISGVADLDDPGSAYRIAILKPLPGVPGGPCVRQHFGWAEGVPGLGHCVTTYVDDGAPLPAFAGEPWPAEVFDDPEETARRYWTLLDEENRVALLAKRIDPATNAADVVITNRFG